MVAEIDQKQFFFICNVIKSYFLDFSSGGGWGE
jgi:hypothetical protein